MCRIYKLLEGFKESFIGYAIRDNPKYGFLPHFRYFLKNKHRWANSLGVLKRILARVPEDSNMAWEVWRQFRSAQAEITSVFLVENYFQGKVVELEVAKPDITKPCDIRAKFPSGKESYLEVKAQSGQQHGDKHPLSSGPIGFTPQSEKDLRSWLLEERTSSKTGELMKPYCHQAAEKAADVLISMTDIFLQESTNMLSLGKRLSPDFGRILCKETSGTIRRQLFVVEGGEEISRKMCGLKEVWIFNNSRLNEVLVIRARNSNAVL